MIKADQTDELENKLEETDAISSKEWQQKQQEFKKDWDEIFKKGRILCIHASVLTSAPISTEISAKVTYRHGTIKKTYSPLPPLQGMHHGDYYVFYKCVKCGKYKVEREEPSLGND